MTTELKHLVVLADCLDNQSAGVKTYTSNFLLALDRIQPRFKVTVIRYNDTDEWENLQTCALPGKLDMLSKFTRMFFQIPRLVEQLDANMALEMAHFGPHRLPKSILRSVFIHDLTPILFPAYHPWHSALLQKTFLSRIVARCSALFVNSENTAKDCRSYFGSRLEPRVIRPGYDETYYFDPERPKVAVDETYQYLLSVGTLEPRKNLSTLLKAFYKLKEDLKWPGKLVLTGSKGWKNGKFKSLLDSHKYRQDIVLTGFVSQVELRRLYSHARAFVYPSFYEGWGLPVHEALMCGTPTICSETSSIPEIGGNQLRYFNPNSVEMLFNSIKMELESVESMDKRKAREMAAKAHDWRKSINKFEDEMYNLLNLKAE